MFKKLFKKGTESTINTKKIIVPCTCDAGNENCDLILQLRKHQGLRNEIKNEIQTLDKGGHELINHFINFLEELKKNGLPMDCFNKWFPNEMIVQAIENTISKCPSAEIFRITQELQTYKNRADIICEKQRALKAVEDDIEKIKTELGIE